MRNRLQRLATRIALAIAMFTLFHGPSAALAGPLGTAQSFTVLGGSAVTSSGLTTVNGDLGVWSGSSITGLGSILLSGDVHDADGVAQEAQLDAADAYEKFSLLPSRQDLSGNDLGEVGTLTPGVYLFASSAQLTGTLILDAQGNPNALFVFKIGSTFTTASNSAVNVINGGRGTGLFWDVGTSATIGVGTAMAGNILAVNSIAIGAGASILCGRAIAQNGAVTMNADSISNTCSNGGSLGSGRNDFGSRGFAGTPVPEPGTLALLGLGLLAFTFHRRTRN